MHINTPMPYERPLYSFSALSDSQEKISSNKQVSVMCLDSWLCPEIFESIPDYVSVDYFTFDIRSLVHSSFNLVYSETLGSFLILYIDSKGVLINNLSSFIDDEEVLHIWGELSLMHVKQDKSEAL